MRSPLSPHTPTLVDSTSSDYSPYGGLESDSDDVAIDVLHASSERKHVKIDAPAPHAHAKEGSFWRKATNGKLSLERSRGTHNDSRNSLPTPPPQHPVRDPGMALDFEKLLMSNVTKKMTSTPDQMKSIEVRKGQLAKLEAKPPVVENDSALLKMLRSDKLPNPPPGDDSDTSSIEGVKAGARKESHWAEFLKTTGPEDMTVRQRGAKKQRPSLPQLPESNIRFPPSPPRSSNDTGRGTSTDMRTPTLNPITETGTSPPRNRALSAHDILYGSTSFPSVSKARSAGQVSEDGLEDLETLPRAPTHHSEGDTVNRKPSTRSTRPDLDLDSDSDDSLLNEQRGRRKQSEKGQSLADFLRETGPPEPPQPLPKGKKKRKTSALRIFSIGSRNKSANNSPIGSTDLDRRPSSSRPNTAPTTPKTPKTPRYTMISVPHEIGGSVPNLTTPTPPATESGRGSLRKSEDKEDQTAPFRKATSLPHMWEGRDTGEDVPPVPKLPAKYDNLHRPVSASSINRVASVKRTGVVMVDRGVGTDIVEVEGKEVGTEVEVDVEEYDGVLRDLIRIDPAFMELVEYFESEAESSNAEVEQELSAPLPTSDSSSTLSSEPTDPTTIPLPPSPPLTPTLSPLPPSVSTSEASTQTIHDVLVAETILIRYPDEDSDVDITSHVEEPHSGGEFIPQGKCLECEERRREEVEGICCDLVSDMVNTAIGDDTSPPQDDTTKITELEQHLQVLARIALRAVRDSTSHKTALQSTISTLQIVEDKYTVMEGELKNVMERNRELEARVVELKAVVEMERMMRNSYRMGGMEKVPMPPSRKSSTSSPSFTPPSGSQTLTKTTEQRKSVSASRSAKPLPTPPTPTKTSFSSTFSGPSSPLLPRVSTVSTTASRSSSQSRLDLPVLEVGSLSSIEGDWLKGI